MAVKAFSSTNPDPREPSTYGSSGDEESTIIGARKESSNLTAIEPPREWLYKMNGDLGNKADIRSSVAV